MTPRDKLRLLRLIATTPGVMKIGPVYASSGSVVPVIPDFRKLYSYPSALQLMGKLLAAESRQLRARVLAGIETAGIPLVAVASIYSRIPMVYLRKKAHAGWSRSIIDGDYKRGARTVLMDDAITFGGQKLNFIRRLKGQLKVVGLLVIWDSSYPSRFRKQLTRYKVTIRAFVTKLEVMDYMLKHGFMHQDTYDVMLAQTNNPWHWNKDKRVWRKMLRIKRRGTL